MKTQVTEKGQWARELAVEVEAARIDEAFNKALRQYQKRLEIPGFRKGKVPLRIVKARFGPSIRGEVLGDLLPSLLEEATQAAGLRPAAPPRISQLDHEPQGGLTFTADLDIWPEIKAEHYENLAATRMIHEVTDEEVGAHLEELRRRHATERVVERSSAQGDVLVADLQRLDDSGLPVIGDKYEKRHLLIDENELGPEFATALVGMGAGEERKVRFTDREDPADDQRASRPMHFAVAAHEVRERTLPELDDEFAKDLGEQFQTLSDLRQFVGEQIRDHWAYMAHQRLHSELISQLIEKNDFELPESMVDNYLLSLEREHADHDHDHDDPDHSYSDEERTQATRQLKRYILLESVRQQAGIEATDEEVAQFTAIAHAHGQAADLPDEEGVRRELEDQKVFDLLVAKAEIKEEKV